MQTELPIELPRGAIVRRSLLGFGGLMFKHVGISLGDGTVVHFSGEKKKERSASIIRVSIAEFAQGKKIELHAMPVNDVHAEAICSQAIEILHNPNNKYNRRYSLWFNNCEDFCVECYEVPFESVLEV